MSRHDVAIYTPAAACLYERQPQVTGGAERQTMLLASGLVDAGLRVAHIVLPVQDPDPGLAASRTLVQRPLVTTGRGPLVRAVQLRHVWSALAEADADVYIFRSGLPALGVTAMLCRLRRRRLIFSASIDQDFTFDLYEGRRPERELYRFGLANADAIVVQSDRQAALARRNLGRRTSRVVEIPSFAQYTPPATASPQAFLWVGRLDEYKQPLRYVTLAEALPEARFWLVARRLDPERSGGSPGGAHAAQLEEEVFQRAAQLPNLEILEQRPHAEAMRLVERAVAVGQHRAGGGHAQSLSRGVGTRDTGPHVRVRPRRSDRAGGLGVSAEGSPERFRDGARRLWERRDDRTDVAARVRSYVERTHSVDAVARRWATLIADARRR